MTTVSVYHAFASGQTDYIAKLNEALEDIEGYLQTLFDTVEAISGVGTIYVPEGLKQIFDRRGLIGEGSYDFSEGTPPGGYLSIAAGAYWSGTDYYQKTTATSILMTGKAAGTYYVNLNTLGTPEVSATPDLTTSRQFAWNGSNTISSKAIYTGVAILFDGDEYADLLTSAARSKSFTQVADRIEEIEVLLGKDVQTLVCANTVAINWALGGTVRITLDRATTLFNFSGAYDGQRLVLEITQDVTGGRDVSFGAMVDDGLDFPFPIPLTGSGGMTDYVGFIYDAGTGLYRYTSLARGYGVAVTTTTTTTTSTTSTSTTSTTT